MAKTRQKHTGLLLFCCSDVRYRRIHTQMSTIMLRDERKLDLIRLGKEADGSDAQLG